MTPGRVPITSRSEPEPLGELKFQEVNCMGEFGTGLSDALTTRGVRHEAKSQRMAKSKKGVDTRTQETKREL